MAIRVALIGTGNCGSLALRQLIEDPRFDLTTVWVSSAAKVGKDAGELARLDVTTGVTATDDFDAVIAADPDCAVYCAMGDVRPREALADVRRLLEAGINVVGSSPGSCPTRGVSSVTTPSRRSKPRPGKVIRACSSPVSTPVSSPTCCRWRWRAPARASPRSAPWRSPTTRPTTGPP